MIRLLPLLFVLVTSIASAEVPVFYQRISAMQNIPSVILYAIAMQESKPPKGLVQGVDKPWPWTLNCDGKGYYYPSRKKAFEALSRNVVAGMSCDIGLMQVSWRYHKARFKSLDTALDPYTNIKTGADILKEQFNLSGSWEHAVGAYHSPSDPVKASRYREMVRGRLAHIMGVSF